MFTDGSSSLKNRYGIPWPYQSRSAYRHHDDSDLTDEWQLEVYLHALELMGRHQFSRILDIGCGSGYKLIHHLGEYETIGLELEQNLPQLEKRYPHHRWEACDLSIPLPRSTDLVICADVIEHLVDPDQLIDYIMAIQFQLLILSTPDRSLLHRPWKRRYWGPPRNPCHQREWTSRQFFEYISGTFDVVERATSNHEQSTQMLVCKRR